MRAWDLSKPFFFAPAMNTYMWQHPITAQQIDNLKSFGYKEIHSISKKLACGDEGTRQHAKYDALIYLHYCHYLKPSSKDV